MISPLSVMWYCTYAGSYARGAWYAYLGRRGGVVSHSRGYGRSARFARRVS